MRRLILLLITLFMCGCSFIVDESNNLKTFGIKKEDASQLTKEIEEQRPKNLTEIHIMQKKDNQGQLKQSSILLLIFSASYV